MVRHKWLWQLGLSLSARVIEQSDDLNKQDGRCVLFVLLKRFVRFDCERSNDRKEQARLGKESKWNQSVAPITELNFIYHHH